MAKTVLFAGSFDPITKGHEDIALRAAKLFDTVVVAVMTNGNKNYYFSERDRLDFCTGTFSGAGNIHVMSYHGLLASLYQETGACAIVKGVRNVTDYPLRSAFFASSRKVLSI